MSGRYRHYEHKERIRRELIDSHKRGASSIVLQGRAERSVAVRHGHGHLWVVLLRGELIEDLLERGLSDGIFLHVQRGFLRLDLREDLGERVDSRGSLVDDLVAPAGRGLSVHHRLHTRDLHLDRVRITQSNVREIGAVLGNIPRTQEINPFGSGGLIYDSIQGEGSVTARLFLDWWLSKDYFLTLQSFMDQEFGERAQLLERSSAQSIRYRIRKITAVMKIPSVEAMMY